MQSVNFDNFSTQEFYGDLSSSELRHAPELLYFSGNSALLNFGKRVSVVGSRKPSASGIKRAKAITQRLVSLEVTVVSGLAMGIDTVAHETTISSGGHTIAVLGSPIDQPYPKKNHELYEIIASNHLAISQFPIGYPIKGDNFPRRNRTMAFISDATIIVEASEKSGTKHQGWEALRLGRQLFLLENVAKDPDLTWPKQMIEYGARVLTRENFEDEINSTENLSGSLDVSF